MSTEMNTEWSLDILYHGLEDPAYEADIKALEEYIEAMGRAVDDVCRTGKSPDAKTVETLLLAQEKVIGTAHRLISYIQLRRSVDTENGGLLAQEKRIQKMLASYSPLEAAAKQYFAAIEDVQKLSGESEVIRAYAFLLEECKEEAKHLLGGEVEEMAAAMDMTGGAAWGSLFSYLTSTVKVLYEGKEITLSEARNLAYSPNAGERKAAYEAELAAYEGIADSLAFALNNIKAQVTMLSEKRGYESPLALTLFQSRMSRKTLDAMMEAVVEYLPVFRKYLRKKAELLGYQGGLPWYELFAPVGKADKKYTIEEAKEYLLRCFGEFAPEMAALMEEAFTNSWIDFYPRKGKEGGAFCAGLMEKKQSRILTNYDGYFGSVDTLAHELGHAFHNRQLEEERPLNQDYPMPVAETASTFNELHLGRYALKTAGGDERLNLLESDLREQTQCIVDIYSRYLFESAVFAQGKERFLMAEDLKELMLDAQRKAYGDGLDEDAMHPYMWACKSHYYYSDLSFYNFPYAFGNLFALGLYAKFLKEGEAFVPKYKEMLKATPCCTVEEAGAMVGADLTSPEFWRQSLAIIADEVEEFCKF